MKETMHVQVAGCMKVMNMLVNMVFFQKVTTDNTDDKKINVMQMTDGSNNMQL